MRRRTRSLGAAGITDQNRDVARIVKEVRNLKM